MFIFIRTHDSLIYSQFISISLYVVSLIELKKSMDQYKRREYNMYRKLNYSIEIIEKQCKNSITIYIQPNASRTNCRR